MLQGAAPQPAQAASAAAAPPAGDDAMQIAQAQVEELI